MVPARLIETNTSSHSAQRAAMVLLAALAAWLLAAALLVDIEYYDGLDTLCNARFFLGKSTVFIGNRAPLMGLILAPAEFIRAAVGMQPLEVRPQHLSMALLHLAYLGVVYALLAATFGRSWAVTLAFAAAVPQYIFFSYAPFISHDILPGALFLGMLVLADRFVERPHWRSWTGLVLCGAAAPLIKHTYALFWMTLLASHALLALRDGGRKQPPPPAGRIRPLAYLAAGAGLSAAIVWMCLALALRGLYPGKPFLSGPWEQIRFLSSQYKGAENLLFPAWVYLRNLPVYGWLTLALIVPGLILAARHSRLLRSAGLSWIGCFAVLHLLSVREVRYLEFLAPVSALLLVLPLRWLLQRRWGWLLALGLLAADLCRVIPEAALITQPFYVGGTQAGFLEPLWQNGVLRQPLSLNNRMFSFPAPEDSPLVGDRYHKLFHLGVQQVAILYASAPNSLWLMPADAEPDAYPLWPEGAAVMLTNRLVLNCTDWQRAPPRGKQELRQIVAVDCTRLLSRQDDGAFRTDAGTSISLRELPVDGIPSLFLEGPLPGPTDEPCLTARLVLPGRQEPFHLEASEPGRFRVLGADAELRGATRLVFRALVIKSAFCGAEPNGRGPGAPTGAWNDRPDGRGAAPTSPQIPPGP
jgi:hypothetical protein